MSRRVRATGREEFRGQVDPTQYVFMCMICPWQVQAGYAARRDLGLDGVMEAIGLAHLDHNDEAHSAGSDIEVELDDGSTHAVAHRESGGAAEGALMATMLPRWWVDR